MSRANPIQAAFNAGEFSPRMVARVDFQKYQSAASLMENLLTLPQGGMAKRPGTRYVAATKSGATEDAILVPFIFSTVQAYILEFGDQYVRFYRNQGQILDGSSPVEVATPYLEADLYDLNFTQSNDTLYIVHPSHAPRTLVRSSDTSWTLSTIDFRDGPYLPINQTSTTLDPSGTTGSVTVVASATTGINDDTGFQSTDVGRHIRYIQGASPSDWFWLKITAVNSTTNVTATWQKENEDDADPTDHPAKQTWRLGLWSDTTSYPAAVTFFQERLWFAGSDDAPQRVDGSVPADYTYFAPTEQVDATVADDNAVSFTIASDTSERIRWLAGNKRLLMGTQGGEWVARSDGAILTPNDVTIEKNTAHGSAQVQPLEVENVIVYVQAAKRKLREMVYNFDVDGYISPDLTILADHVTKSGIIQMAYQQEPDSVIWALREDGQLATLTYKRDQDVVGWTRQIMGGVFGGDSAVVRSVAVIPGNDGAGQVYSSAERDEVWMIVKRTINGATVRYVEVLEGLYSAPRREDYATEALWQAALLADQERAFSIDSGLTYDGAATTTITGLDHLEGETVKVWANGGTHPDVVVSSGSI